MGAYRNPFGGQRAPSSSKVSRPKQFRKNKSDRASKDRNAPKKTPLLALLGVVGSFAAMWSFTVFKLHGDTKQKSESDRKILKSLMYKPILYSDHAICRMKCR